ncbi:MAG: hypothetical protein J6Q92_09010 [Oscillospiraceae bacterium]|nr:hypothetical protein [Oscillospiraceae bacterium]
MKKRMIALVLLVVLLLPVLCACGKKSDILTQDQAVERIAEHLNIDAKDMENVYVHVADGENNPCYSMHFSYNGKDYSLMVDVVTGEVMESDH